MRRQLLFEPKLFCCAVKSINNSLCSRVCAGQQTEVPSCGSDQTPGRFRQNAQEGRAQTADGRVRVHLWSQWRVGTRSFEGSAPSSSSWPRTASETGAQQAGRNKPDAVATGACLRIEMRLTLPRFWTNESTSTQIGTGTFTYCLHHVGAGRENQRCLGWRTRQKTLLL